MSNVLARGGGRVFQVLTYHCVSPLADDVLDPTPPGVFEMQVRHLARYYNVLTAGEAARRAREGSLPPRAVCITLDDGYEDNHRYALPILKRYGLKATVFVATGPLESRTPLWYDRVVAAFALTGEAAVTLDGARVSLASKGRRWEGAKAFLAHVSRLGETERREAVEEVCGRLGVSSEQAWNRTPMLTWDQVREMAEAGMEIGAHTVTHPVLSLLTPERQAEEIRGSVETLERRMGVRPRCFAYPNGRAEDFDETTVSLIRSQGLEAAYTTVFGTNSAASDPFRLKRGAGWAHQAWRYGLQMLWYRWTT